MSGKGEEDSSFLDGNDAPVGAAEPPRSEGSQVFLYGLLGTSVIGFTVFIIVRYGPGWAEALEAVFGIADGFWIGAFVLLGICFVGAALLLIATIAAKFEPERREQALAPGDESGRQNLKHSLQSSRTLRMAELLRSALGNESLARENRALFAGSETWESLVMLALVYERTAEMLREALEWDASRDTAAHSMWRAANLIDGVPEHEENVSTWRKAPGNPDWCDWVTVAGTIAEGWSKSAGQLRAAAENVRGTPRHTPAVDEFPKSREFTGKVRRCIRCGVEIPEGRLQCPSCGNSRFIWE